MPDQVKAECEPRWYCPKCDMLDESDGECDFNTRTMHNGDSIDVKCSECHHEYEVIL